MYTSKVRQTSKNLSIDHANIAIAILVVKQSLSSDSDNSNLFPHDLDRRRQQPLGFISSFCLDVDYTRMVSWSKGLDGRVEGGDVQRKKSRTRLNSTEPSNSGCRKTSRLTLSFRTLCSSTLTSFVSGSTLITPGEKHLANLSAR